MTSFKNSSLKSGIYVPCGDFSIQQVIPCRNLMLFQVTTEIQTTQTTNRYSTEIHLMASLKSHFIPILSNKNEVLDDFHNKTTGY